MNITNISASEVCFFDSHTGIGHDVPAGLTADVSALCAIELTNSFPLVWEITTP